MARDFERKNLEAAIERLRERLVGLPPKSIEKRKAANKLEELIQRLGPKDEPVGGVLRRPGKSGKMTTYRKIPGVADAGGELREVAHPGAKNFPLAKLLDRFYLQRPSEASPVPVDYPPAKNFPLARRGAEGGPLAQLERRGVRVGEGTSSVNEDRVRMLLKRLLQGQQKSLPTDIGHKAHPGLSEGMGVTNVNPIRERIKKLGRSAGKASRVESLLSGLTKRAAMTPKGEQVAAGLTKRIASLGGMQKALKIEKYAKSGGNILGGLFLANAARETYRDDRTARAIDTMSPADPRALLEGLRREELLRARTSRLAQQDPVAMMMLKRLMAGKQMPPKLATGEYMVGQAMEQPDAGDEDVQALLATLG